MNKLVLKIIIIVNDSFVLCKQAALLFYLNKQNKIWFKSILLRNWSRHTWGRRATNLGGKFFDGIYLQMGTTSLSIHFFSNAVKRVVLPRTDWKQNMLLNVCWRCLTAIGVTVYRNTGKHLVKMTNTGNLISFKAKNKNVHKTI